MGFTIMEDITHSENEMNKAKALITGASSGIGAEFARQLAAKGYDLILVARRRERLEHLAAEIQSKRRAAIDIQPVDLSILSEIQKLERLIGETEDLEVLVNNAGFGIPGTFLDTDVDAIMTMVRVHVEASVRLTHAALPAMIARDTGFIIQVSSISSFNAATGSPAYAATKAYLNAFTDGLATQLFDTNIKAQALCPGFTRTEFHDSPEYQKMHIQDRLPAFFWMDAEDVVRPSLQALQHGSGIYVPGFGNKLLAFLGTSGLTRLAIRLYQAIFHRATISS